MAGTRSSARQAEKNASSPQSATKTNGTKRKADETSSPSNAKKRGRPSKEQKTLEETISKDDGQDEQMKDNELVSDEKVEEEIQAEEKTEEKKIGENKEETESEKPTEENGDKNALEQVKADEKEEGKTSKIEDAKDVKTDGDDTKEKAVEEDKKREEAQPSNILEKGIIYFFTRGRVGVDDPDSVQDLQRSFFVLRPLPAGAKLTEGAIQDVGNNRLIALPKKVWPKSGKDRFMAFVEKAKTSMNELKETFFQGSEYSTATTGTRHQSGVTLVGEGVYAMTRTGGGQGTTHLAWQLTIPSEVGEVQKDIGLDAKSSLILSVKNPESSAPANAQLPQTAEYPKEFIEEFAGRGWLPAQPKHLDYDNASFLLIGEDFDSSSNLDPAPKDEKKEEKETPQEELEKLEGEDEHRVENLKGDDTIFTDLGISSKEYGLKTTW